ncbi:ABSCISIC ACID-INSENSITIVE 5-like protein 1 [Impatiens glandulifera]|uniref:ABSCISIC ACID-INSENSITIVE 5-like protein 1 n=1 Tax=Impatiens glandulifera TaxID=253017 RepID=UPI001FB1519A|nr:ABSCISIC ACID-INSENSITIVE 5-like protein 1 [Impatiens glandulifera]
MHTRNYSPMENESLSSTEQNSIFSLTLEELQLKTGRNFGSMNMDELLNSIWNMDAQQQQDLLSTLNQNEGEILADGPIFHGQGSFNIPAPLCNKTVEEVWAEIQRSQSFQENHTDLMDNGVLETQLTFGEMTLEDFLVKVGALHGVSLDLSSSQLIIAALTNTSMNFSSNNASFNSSIVIPDQPMMDVEFSQTNNGGGGVLVGNGSNSMYPMYVPTNGSYIGESSRAGAIGKGSSGSRTKRRSTMASCSTEVAIERRQRRMIKNRESAARSRARKQAYTAELEIELDQVREENTRLRLIVEEAENKKREEEMNENSSPNEQVGGMKKLKAIRRTSSTSW